MNNRQRVRAILHYEDYDRMPVVHFGYWNETLDKWAAEGHITPEQAAVHPMRNVLYRALGQVDDTEADLYVRPLSAGDWLVLCSDGLTRHVTGAEIAEIVRASAAPDEVTHRLVTLANERGGEDNITVAIIQYGARLDESTRPMALPAVRPTPIPKGTGCISGAILLPHLGVAGFIQYDFSKLCVRADIALRAPAVDISDDIEKAADSLRLQFFSFTNGAGGVG